MLKVERWDVFEWSGTGRADGNPFVDYDIAGVFRGPGGTEVRASGFYDGEGTYRVRFMPEMVGKYTYEISGSFSDEIFSGEFESVPASGGNHGPVRVHGYHFRYADGTPFHPAGTTCYVWNHQSPELQRQTLDELRNGWFNKIRFCVFPKHYLYNFHEPVSYPYEGTPCRIEFDTAAVYPKMGRMPGNDWDFYRFNPVHFRNVENAIMQLRNLGIEADLIVMHPYDRWGFAEMEPDQDDLYWKYVLARFSAYRNVWWSLANEYDLLTKKTVADWERFADIIVHNDPYHHLRSIHNCITPYDHTRPWITHVSMQRVDYYKTTEYADDYRVRYGKPVVMDEICYEGDIDHGWGNISGRELVRRFWEGATRGAYCTHGETFVGHDDILWWSHGGKLYGESPARIRFLTRILDETPGGGLKANPRRSWDESSAVSETDPDYRLYYYGFACPSSRLFFFEEDKKYRVEVIDTWNMTITDMGVHSGTVRIPLPGREYMAVRVTRA